MELCKSIKIIILSERGSNITEHDLRNPNIESQMKYIRYVISIKYNNVTVAKQLRNRFILEKNHYGMGLSLKTMKFIHM